MYDIIIVGAGPAGLTAAVYALRANKTVLLIEKNGFGGQMTFSPKIENFPGEKEISGTALADKMVDQALSLGAEIEFSAVTEIKTGNEYKTVVTEDGSFECRAVIIATGAKHRLLGVQREAELSGNGISYCAVCDGAFFEGKKVGVVGGGNSALQEAMLLSELCSQVYIIQNLGYLTGEEKLGRALLSKGNVKAFYNKTVKAFLGKEELNGIVIEDSVTKEESTLELDGLFVAIGLAPENKPFEGVAELDKIGYIMSDENCATKTEGVFVAGDCCTKSVRQITTAVSDGAVSALAAIRYIDNR